MLPASLGTTEQGKGSELGAEPGIPACLRGRARCSEVGRQQCRHPKAHSGLGCIGVLRLGPDVIELREKASTSLAGSTTF